MKEIMCEKTEYECEVCSKRYSEATGATDCETRHKCDKERHRGTKGATFYIDIACPCQQRSRTFYHWYLQEEQREKILDVLKDLDDWDE